MSGGSDTATRLDSQGHHSLLQRGTQVRQIGTMMTPNVSWAYGAFSIRCLSVPTSLSNAKQRDDEHSMSYRMMQSRQCCQATPPSCVVGPAHETLVVSWHRKLPGSLHKQPAKVAEHASASPRTPLQNMCAPSPHMGDRGAHTFVLAGIQCKHKALSRAPWLPALRPRLSAKYSLCSTLVAVIYITKCSQACRWQLQQNEHTRHHC